MLSSGRSVCIVIFYLLIASPTHVFSTRHAPSPAQPQSKKPVTIFIHGILPPFSKRFVHKLDFPLGLTPAPCIQNKKKFIMNRLGPLLSRADAEQFPLETFYYFGWSGTLSFKLRYQAAEELYHIIKDWDAEITVIGHSHGGNVALELAHVAELHGDNNFRIKRLILLAVPVQEITKYNAASPVFEEVYALHSGGDYVQTGDPQGMYQATRAFVGDELVEIPFFSERFFPPAQNTKNIRILIGKCNPSHLDFILPRFISRLPQVLEMVQAIEGGHLVTINMSYTYGGIPEFVKPVCKNKKKRFIPVTEPFLESIPPINCLCPNRKPCTRRGRFLSPGMLGRIILNLI